MISLILSLSALAIVSFTIGYVIGRNGNNGNILA